VPEPDELVDPVVVVPEPDELVDPVVVEPAADVTRPRLIAPFAVLIGPISCP
jgi:hypothetical protein